MGKSDKIEAFILELLKQEDDDWLTIQRNELAQIFDCVPSQINYVISTRFNNDRGYQVESRRGGGGYVMIRRMGNSEGIGNMISYDEGKRMTENLYNRGRVSAREARIIISAIGSASDDKQRAQMLKNIMSQLPQ